MNEILENGMYTIINKIPTSTGIRIPSSEEMQESCDRRKIGFDFF